MYALAEQALANASAKFDDAQAVAYPSTAYISRHFICNDGQKERYAGRIKGFHDRIKGQMTREKRLHDVFTSGIATACAAEVIEACKYIGNTAPYEAPYLGHVSDAEVRELGVPLVTGDIPGFVVIIGSAPSDEKAVEIIKSYQTKSIFVFLVGGICKQAERAGVKMGFPVRVYPCGDQLPSVCHVVSVAVRAAMIFGNIQAGDYDGIRDYTFKRINAAVNAYEPVDDMTVACGGGAISYGWPVVTNDDHDMWRVPKSLIVQPDVDKFVDTAIEARGMKLKITNIDIPVAFSTAFEGEVIRKADMQLEANGARIDCFELVRTKELSEIEDHKIELIGKDFDAFEAGGAINIGMIAYVAGKRMQSDFEPVFERKFHAWLNCIEGVMHTGQRDMIRIRINKEAYENGFRAKHFGEVLYAKLKSEFEAVVDKCQITIITDPEQVKQGRADANKVYEKRDARLKSLTDETAKEFYSCLMCQSFSPTHVCIVTPERLGLCGAVSCWTQRPPMSWIPMVPAGWLRRTA
jgi:acetyl-CoA synthase